MHLALLLSYAIILCNLGSVATGPRSKKREVDLISTLYAKAAKLPGLEKVEPKGYKITSKWNPRNLPNIKFKRFWKKYHGKLTFYFSGQIIPQSKPIPIFSIYHKRKLLPYFEALVDFQKGKVIIRYQGVTSFQRSFISFDSTIQSISGAIIQIKTDEVRIQLDCLPLKSVKLRQKIAPIPRSSKIALQDFKSKEKVIGLLFEAKVYSYINNIPTTCFSKAVAAYQKDDSKVSTRTATEELRSLQRRVSHLTSVVDQLQAENLDLKARLNLLDSCVCYPQCLVNGVIYADGESWQKDTCTFCTCREGQEDCIRRVELPQCHAPCVTSPCQNNGYCVDTHPDPSGYHCMCQPPYDGPLCETRQNPCVWPQEPGLCNNTMVRYYYDRFEEECQAFNYTGCGGNVNNYESFEACREVAMTGACCFRRFKADEKALITGNQMKESKCQVLSLKDCKAIHNQKRKHYTKEVVAFYPSLSCEEAGCMNTQSGCVYDGTSYQPGAVTYQGCQKCTCEIDERWTCQCETIGRRKDIRDMSQSELSRFQTAVQQLRFENKQWEKFRDMYMAHGMHANGGPYFLPWHRVFLREVEKKLQKIDCGITMPYFDFTTDVGNFAEAIIWQPNYFGGDGSGFSHCVPDHSFGTPGSWQPCIMRNFHTTIELPTMVDLALALSSDDYTEMSMSLESYISYLHRYIGGDMATTGGPYDPVFFAIHSFVDMLYWRWQQRGNNKFKYPAAFGNIPMVPFNIPPSSVLDLEADLCVTYAPPSLGHPCNTSTGGIDTSGADRGDTPSSKVAVVNYPGYVNGFDRNGYDLGGYKENGLNRDGFDKDGYDVDGYNRYGYDKDGYNRWGFNRTGYDRGGKQDTHRIYDQNGFDDQCLDIQGLTKYGFDRFGFTPAGFDKDGCNFLYKGPFDVLHSLRIWELLSLQDRGFLLSVYRLCPSLDPVPLSWSRQFWAPKFKDVSGLVHSITPETTLSIPSSRFCFETTPYLTPCTCETSITSCTENPCLTDVCPSYPEAICHVDFCSECKATWYYNNQEVDCLEDRDFCDPNPCLNGGTCQKSIWPTEPQLVTCRCPPGYDRHLCQYTSIEVCSLPLSIGSCNDRESRWFYNHQTQNCESFIYSGCGGNANHFLTEEACQSRCVIGACCHRKPLFKRRLVGYNLDNYDRYGFDKDGNSRRGDTRNTNNSTPFGSERFNSKGYDWEGYDVFGYDKDGYDRLGYNSEGYDREGFNIQGYNRIEEYDGILEYNKEGYNVEGFNRAGMNCQGYNRRGLDYYGMSTGYSYKCSPMSLIQCQNLERNSDTEVVQFRPGKQCAEVGCGEKCGCTYRNNTYTFGQEFRIGCQTCTCTIRGSVTCRCMRYNFRRREIRDMTKEELELYQTGIKRLATSTGHEPSLWFQFADMYLRHKPQAVGSDQFLPWHRAFLKYVEQHLQNINCDITIPYYDWTIDAGEPHKSVIWSMVVFGGNGEGQNGCVPHHSFKDYYPPSWVPCLRRQFNNSVTFPDAINVQLAVNDPSYTNFRLQMEMMLASVQSYVGGHMYSDLSPYDPVFMSVIAYIDKLWTLWQEKHPDWTASYPVELRYKPMDPFKLSPEDVMYSSVQMCVDYVPLTYTTLCNISLPRYGYDEDGYDRHGLDREGYDRDGFNIDGFDRNGNRDMRGVFSTSGYDRGGFNRQGFDVSGFDRYGFYIDMYNLDGFDSKGYDRWGYDRYGYNINGVTPYGFNRNGTWNPDADQSVINKFGYNVYGFNKYGYDRNGYDVFGFDSRGLDKHFCNNFYLGPVYMVIKRWVELELEKLDKGPILDIYRLCPYVTFMPTWMYTVNWFTRNDQVNLINTLEKQARADHRFEPTYLPRSSSVTELNLWLPVPPDQRLCFVTNYFSGCPFGRFPVTCRPDLCKGRKCPGIPDAVCRINTCGDCSIEWYNGLTGAPVVCSGCVTDDGREEPEGATWRRSECDVCSCQDGMVRCSTTLCPAVTCRNPVQIPGQCCASCEGGCQYEGRIYEPGVTFTPDSAPCSVCVCNRGDVTCRPRPCKDLGKCKSSMTLPGDCCPTCMDCGRYANASMWKQGPCQKCSCINGNVQCSELQCGIPDCKYPYTPPGECCPTCVSCYYNRRTYEDGSQFDLDACTRCSCRHGDVQCSKTACPVVSCPNPITPPGECCPVCTSDCEYDMQTYRHMESFLASYDPCLNCSCTNSIVRCIPIMCPHRDFPCRNPIRKGKGCCEFVCPSCVDGGREYYNGDTWPSPRDPCQVCQCSEGIVTCKTNKSCMYRCTHGVIPQGKCCSDCRDCLFNGRLISDGRRFQAPGDRCQQCTCERGNVRCQSSGPCPSLTCTITEQLPGECCPRCKGCLHNGQQYQNGDTVSASLCESCVCNQGAVECKAIGCGPPRCEQPVQVPGQCCPVCQGCEYRGRSYPEGQSFSNPQDRCEQCICQNGRVQCNRRTDLCSPRPCSHPETLPGDCCPVCDGCLFMRRRFANGQKFVPAGGDPCKICRCVGGNVTCMSMGCPPLKCKNPVKPPGYCCGVCPLDCVVRGRNYSEGQTFADPRDKCNVCTCADSSITCQPMVCPVPQCNNPTIRPGECCPSCQMCSHGDRQLQNGESYVNPKNPCQQCTCQNGVVSCTSVRCPVLNCIDPVYELGKCCPSCSSDKCVVEGRTYRSGDSFCLPSDPCQECHCIGSKATCAKRECPETRCRNPAFLAGKCCPECKDCNYNGLIYRDKEDFVNPRDRCQTCTCRLGNVACKATNCVVTKCQHPVTNRCCPECDGCFYKSRTYRNGERFQDSRDPCVTCTCRDGDVACVPNPCPAASCKNPVQGRCCAECADCMYQGRRLKDNQRFRDNNNPCNECICRQGSVACTPLPCPTATCSNPTQGRCCPECRDCLVDGRVISNNQMVPSPPGSCQDCVCRNGNTECRKKRCPRAQCSHPVKRECCEVCTDCVLNGVEYRNGEMFPDSSDRCRECQCVNGNVQCKQKVCQDVRRLCNSPAVTDCCPKCQDCQFRNQFYRDGENFPDVSDPCKECVCRRGSVNCAQRTCPAITCSHPIRGQCCPQCGSDCLYNNKLIRDNQSFKESCRNCTCSGGTVSCSGITCPNVQCSHPVYDECCKRCNRCLLEGRIYGDGERFQDRDDPCSECVCQGGSVSCSKKPCPVQKCSHPIMNQCCPECTDCLYEGVVIRHGESHRKDACHTCSCRFGSVDCVKVDCPRITCSSPYTDTCGCRRCDRCSHEGNSYDNGVTFPDPQDKCRQCQCLDGNVRCLKKTCPVQCTHPSTTDGCCPICTKCLYDNKVHEHGQLFTPGSDLCQQCQCREGSVQCLKKTCPELCTHPSTTDGCCPICRDCMYEGDVQKYGSVFTSRRDPCQQCQCRDGNVNCLTKTCPPLNCPRPVTRPGECCPECQVCNFLGGVYNDGERFKHPQDKCKTCTCYEGNVRCLKDTCPKLCTHPSTTDGCCPICQDCMYEGVIQKYGSVFTSRRDPCQQCQCRDGNVNCLTTTCPPLDCPRPVTRPGECCPECPVCNFLGRVYDDGERFKHPQDQCKSCTCYGEKVECVRQPCVTPCTYPTQGACCPLCDNCEFEGKIRQNGATFKPDACRTCTCTNGNVKCITQSCPPLGCIQQEVPEGECCPVCKSCTFNGRQYVDGSEFTLDTDPCMTCLCHNTVMTCEQKKCFSVCDNPMSVPGQCCPVCPTCNYQGRDYREGETFQLRGDACDVCTCSRGRLNCHHKVCPRTATCPPNQIISPLPGECCPTCAGLGYNCSRTDIGQVLRTKPSDACFKCECRAEKNWMCTYDPCPPVSCPPSVQIRPPGQCCPTCPACHDLEVDRWYEEGTSWSGDSDPCVHCECQNGDVMCHVIGCPAVVCNRQQRFVRPPGKCCAMCEDLPAIPCQYQGSVYQAGEKWRVDDCTECRCMGRDVECLTQKCPPLDCDPSDVASATPGSCCPVCVTRPGTCLVFGDPHYYTFDGSTIHFQGFCQYTMATDCVNNDFAVDVHHDNRGISGHVSWAQNFTITLGQNVIHLLQNHVVEVDGRRVELPFYNQKFSVEHNQDSVLFNTKLGVKLVWNGNSYAELSVPGTYRDKLCGLCGNFNGFPTDDLKTKGGRITNSPSIFGNSWKTSQQENAFCEDGTDRDPCVEAGYRARKFANTQCSILRGPKFSRCHRTVAPDPFYAACVYDLCVCGDNSTCLCDILSSYAKECAKAGVRLEWREPGLCDFGCDESLGFVFDECGPVCPRTCENYDTPIGDLKTKCFKPCIASCQCPADKVLLNRRCVAFDECPRIDRGDIPVGPAQG